MTARESQAKDRITLADLIFLKEGIHVCIVCCNEKGLRKLTCGHLECLTCLGKKERLQRQQKKKRTFLSCCIEDYPGCKAESFPVASLELSTNDAIYEQREKNQASTT
ncbi:hypothetical protein EB796_025097 [Bugula neritina]|uniref:Uncharacterized protein n=1 Tax=Bugula neritina TaxID=10212 RepID=A0A7J7IRY9_BUGNE|nr:hypothetical protein EB796_025097 [Bugula neritina]